MSVVKFESCDNWEVWLYVWGEVGTRDCSSVGKIFKAEVNMIIYDSVYWGVNRGGSTEPNSLP